MFKFSKLLSLVLVMLIASLMIGGECFAQARHGLQITTAIEGNADLKLPAGTWVYGLKIYADEASSVMAVYNTTTAPAGDAAAELAGRKDEIGEATQYDSKVDWFPEPIYYDTGVSVLIYMGVGYIYYGPPPK